MLCWTKKILWFLHLKALGKIKDTVAAVRTQDIAISFEELHDKPIDHEDFMKQHNIETTNMNITAHVTRHSENNFGRLKMDTTTYLVSNYTHRLYHTPLYY
ncbi:hypothetical protein Ddye_011732 [Dipteronia dyeriana]|uniref:Uncharacterized protein n=1 Tax=Dipteronia dyeriana TaxID=168575 RepID=A0AAD9X317_9ROSI|nr:hypothetical protein Ddye_011732 [Dipteronia dyeriana]